MVVMLHQYKNYRPYFKGGSIVISVYPLPRARYLHSYMGQFFFFLPLTPCTWVSPIIDTEDPTVICPTNQTTETDLTKSTNIVVWGHPVASDNSKRVPTLSCNALNGSQFEIGETEVICKALDQAGNQAKCSFIVDVKGK